jgi:MFS family permease
MIERLYGAKAFAALGARNFRIFIFGQSVSLVGTWMQRLAMSWLVLRLTGSGAGLGLIEMSNQAPILITGFFAGAIVDRFNVKRVLLVTQTLCMLQALALAVLDFSGVIRYSQVLLLSFFLGLVTSVDLPARQAGAAKMLDRPEQLSSALSINSAIFNVARLIGPPVAGFMLMIIGEAGCFLLNACSFMAVIFSLTKLRIKDAPELSLSKKSSGLRSFKEGVRYVKGFGLLRRKLIFSAFFFFICLPYATLLPFFARNIFKSPSVLGFFLASVGLGAIVGVIVQASFVPVERLHRQVVISTASYGAGLALFALSRSVPLSCAALAFAGFGLSAGSVGFNTFVQSIIDDDKRGRVMSIYTVGNIGFGPMGSLVAGALADAAGGTVSALLFSCGAFALALTMANGVRNEDAAVAAIIKSKSVAARP